jgi:hypothetical protein
VDAQAQIELVARELGVENFMKGQPGQLTSWVRISCLSPRDRAMLSLKNRGKSVFDHVLLASMHVSD